MSSLAFINSRAGPAWGTKAHQSAKSNRPWKQKAASAWRGCKEYSVTLQRIKVRVVWEEGIAELPSSESPDQLLTRNCYLLINRDLQLHLCSSQLHAEATVGAVLSHCNHFVVAVLHHAMVKHTEACRDDWTSGTALCKHLGITVTFTAPPTPCWSPSIHTWHLQMCQESKR